MSLDAIATADGRFAILAMDQRESLRAMLNEAGQPSGDGDLSAFKVDVIGALGPFASGVLTDAEYGVGPARAAGVLDGPAGLLIAAEGGRPDRVAASGGMALKYMLRWKPSAAAPELTAVQAVVAGCRAFGLPSVVEPLVGDPNRVIASAELLAALEPDLLKLEWPGSAAGCFRLSEVCGAVPWTLLSAGVGYDTFVERTLTAMDAGACGYIAGRAFWREAVALTGAERHTFLHEVAARRMVALNQTTEGHGRSWREVAGG